MKKELLTVIVPAYNEEMMIQKAYTEISDALVHEKIPNRIIFVDDGSKDSTWNAIQELSKSRGNVIGLKFSRNFGKEAAINAGLKKGFELNPCGCFAVIDCDLQHPPVKLCEMYRKWQDGYEIIEGIKVSRGKENAAKGIGAKLFYSIMSKSAKMDMSNASDFKLLDYKAVVAILNIKEQDAFFRALSSWVGFKTDTVEFEVSEREIGESKWSTKDLIKYAVSNITSFSNAPMQIITFLGVFIFGISLVLGIIALYQKAAGVAVEGFTTVIILQLLSSSVIMISLGIIGYYISKIFKEVQSRPKYIVSESCGISNEE